uniref:DNA gyrase C-terminal beta-propeller domain-containing protein n=1 Tax=uncultured Duncaniella sp. TaxID=2768039 RepID=UPI0026748ABB
GITLRIHVSDIKVQGRSTQGVRIINLDKRGDSIASVCCVDSDPEEEVTEVEAQDELLEDLIDDTTVEEIDEIEEIDDEETSASDDESEE